MPRVPTLIAAACAAVAPFLPGGAARPDALDLPVVGLAVIVVLAAGVSLSRTPWARIPCALVGTAVAAVCLRLDVADGLPAPRLSVLAAAGLGVAIAIAARDRVRLVAAVAIVGLAIAVPAVTRVAVVHSETAGEGGAVAPVVERPVTRRWAWESSDPISYVVAAGRGVAVATVEGEVVGLDGVDGRVRWRYARSGGHVLDLTASADERAVVVAFGSPADTTSNLVVVLDAQSGRPRFERVVSGVLVSAGEIVPGKATMALREGTDDHTIVAYDLETGGERWRWHAPTGCTSPYALPARGRDIVVAPLECPERVGIMALDEVDGRQRWMHVVTTRPPDGQAQTLLPRGARDGALLSLSITTGRAVPGAALSGLFDSATGVRYPDHPEQGWWVRLDLGPTPVVERSDHESVLDPRKGTLTPLTHAACEKDDKAATTASTYLYVCDGGDRVSLSVQDFTGTPAAVSTIDLPASPGSRIALVPASGAVVLARVSGDGPATVVGMASR
ncbi:hypothetical protein GCM10022243_30520 [Saccharothrix violaceirubra]|uniref:Pyrrolo-quinoline quinone repeat domain-containing protein n=1 Tax=Saccharothrix violaceirubra TaxID=413306 RepID=A0A7W7WXJ1_9PSEU|nr:PQQ-binding-like beta-propeller repeat protein [Saccharothrix violaceirubra]MBB4966678.1 hypothetical protein [Saccharothrix violaceirubra]